MDLGSSAALSDPRGAVERLEAQAGASFPAIAAARERSAARTRDAVAALDRAARDAADPAARADPAAPPDPAARADPAAPPDPAARADPAAPPDPAARADPAAPPDPAARADPAAPPDPAAATAAPAGISVCVFGSWARAELTDASDDDWAVLVETASPAQARALLARAQAVLGSDERGPGAQGVFGGVIEAARLARDIGLDDDTNTNTTQRMLLLLESIELHGSARGAALDRILARYLDQTLTDFQPPRFLLNDLVRYWRTICVDFEGKQAVAGTEDAKWAMRNAKLRTSRKLLFAGGLVPLLLCRTCRAHEMPAFLRRWLDAPALDRLAAAFLMVDAEEVGVRALGAYDRWLALNGDPAARADLASVSFASRERSPVFAEVRAIGETFENGLVALLFSTQLGQVTRKYAIF